MTDLPVNDVHAAGCAARGTPECDLTDGTFLAAKRFKRRGGELGAMITRPSTYCAKGTLSGCYHVHNDAVMNTFSQHV
jgi:hypothetical protein